MPKKIINEANVVKELEHMMEFQIFDLIKASILAKANFLCAMGCMNSLEFLGGIKNNKLGCHDGGALRDRLEAGIGLLVGNEYKNINIYELRNSLTHQYLAEVGGITDIDIANNWNDNKAIGLNRTKTRLKLNVAKFIQDIVAAWGQLRGSILDDRKEKRRVAQLLNSLPRLR